MSEALAVIDVEVPLIRPPGVTIQQWRLAVLYPRAKNAYQALVQAGYARSTALGAAKPTLESLGVKRASEAIAAAKRDSAAAIKSKSAARVLAEVERDGVDPMFALSAWTSASKVKAEYPDEEAGLGDGERETARAYVRRIVRACLVACSCETSLADDAIDAIVASCEG